MINWFILLGGYLLSTLLALGMLGFYIRDTRKLQAVPDWDEVGPTAKKLQMVAVVLWPLTLLWLLLKGTRSVVIELYKDLMQPFADIRRQSKDLNAPGENL